MGPPSIPHSPVWVGFVAGGVSVWLCILVLRSSCRAARAPSQTDLSRTERPTRARRSSNPFLFFFSSFSSCYVCQPVSFRIRCASDAVWSVFWTGGPSEVLSQAHPIKMNMSPGVCCILSVRPEGMGGRGRHPPKFCHSHLILSIRPFWTELRWRGCEKPRTRVSCLAHHGLLFLRQEADGRRRNLQPTNRMNK